MYKYLLTTKPISINHFLKSSAMLFLTLELKRRNVIRYYILYKRIHSHDSVIIPIKNDLGYQRDVFIKISAQLTVLPAFLSFFFPTPYRDSYVSHKVLTRLGPTVACLLISMPSGGRQ